jgi:oxygen-independent coproporphyrinogen-3 oxidase
VIDQARELGFSSVNIDLIYGLPRQTLKSIAFTMGKVSELRPDRIAFYSYAHVPWKSKGQRRYTDEDVPKGEEKLAMYELGNKLLTEMGFEAIGMDHFASPNDKLLHAFKAGTLHRNFMGYTTNNHKLVIGLGASSIGDSWTAFAQNEKEVEAYQERIALGELPLVNGHLLNNEDLYIRGLILDIMCKGTATIDISAFSPDRWREIREQLEGFQADGLARLEGERLQLTPAGRLFVRNICAVFDAYLGKTHSSKPVFSRSV